MVWGKTSDRHAEAAMGQDVALKHLTAFQAGRLVEAFAWGQSMAELARRFRVSRARVEAAIRRAARRKAHR